MDKQEVISYFNECAPTWDRQYLPVDVFRRILDTAGIAPGETVLDVACGTGVMIPFYLERDVRSVTGIDIAPEMAKRAAEKFASHGNIRIVCGDVEETDFPEKFDHVMVHNAFPHFPDPARLIDRLAGQLRRGGRLTVAHSMSREQINAHHSGSARHVSCALMAAEELKALFETHFSVDAVISDGEMYLVSGILRSEE